MKTYSLFAGGILAVFLCLISCEGNNSDKARIAYLESQLEELRQQNELSTTEETATESTKQTSNSSVAKEGEPSSGSTNYYDYVGTYEFTDDINTWVLSIFEDETAQIKNESGNTICYGSCSDFLEYSNYISVWFSDEYPIIFFPSGEEKGYNLCIYRGANYLYCGSSAANAKNPRKRLTLKKIE